ncbi:YdcF family protein [Halomonas sp. CS7]|uniref:YdcF family protein n=1 Tax=Halomonas pelophila TaxID=3151122 RepID=A0ABV1N8H1_9GAMM
MYELSKIVSLLLYPMGISVCLFLAALAFLLLSRFRVATLFLALGLTVLWIFSTPAVADRLLWWLERDWADRPVEAVPAADAILVLGGAFSTGNGQWVYPSAGGAIDRYWHAARLYHAGRAPRVILSGGRVPQRIAGMSEAEAGARFLGDMGVPQEALILETQAITTRGHVEELAPLLAEHAIQSLLVVTSASHMRRSLATLSALEVQITPVATGFSIVQPSSFRLRRLLPSAGALSRSTRAMHEMMGLAYYRLRGWI